MMTRYFTIGFLVLSLIGSGWMIKYQQSRIQDLNIRIEEVEAVRQAEQSHFERELERQMRMNQLELYLKESANEAENDFSDDGSFSASRLRRLDKIR